MPEVMHCKSPQALLGVHPVTLRFKTPQFESAYAFTRAEHLSRVSDRVTLLVTLPLTLPFLTSQFVSYASVPSVACGMGSLALCLVQWLLMRAQGGAQWVEYRQYYLVRLRALRLALFVLGARLGSAQATEGAESCVLHSLMLRSGVLCQVWLALTAPLLFSTHLWLQGVGTGFTLFFFSKKACSQVLASQSGLEAVRWLWYQMDTSLTTYARVGNSVFGMELYSPEPQDSCLQIVILMHLAIGFLAPSFVLYVWELESRKSYLLKQRSKTGDYCDSLCARSTPDPAQISAVLLSFTALLWIPLRFL